MNEKLHADGLANLESAWMKMRVKQTVTARRGTVNGLSPRRLNITTHAVRQLPIVVVVPSSLMLVRPEVIKDRFSEKKRTVCFTESSFSSGALTGQSPRWWFHRGN